MITEKNEILTLGRKLSSLRREMEEYLNDDSMLSALRRRQLNETHPGLAAIAADAAQLAALLTACGPQTRHS